MTNAQAGSGAVAIIGAGVVGAACARALQVAGHDVILFDPAPPGSNCSFGNAGAIAIDHIRPLARPDVLAAVPRMLAAPLGPLALRWRGVPALSPWLGRFTAAARPPRVRAGTAALAGLLASALPDWQAMLAGAKLSHMLRHRGTLSVMETASGLAAAEAEGRVLAAHGVPFQPLSGAETRDFLPGLAITPAAGRLYAGAAHVINPFRLVQSLVERTVADGARLIAEPVLGFRREGARITAVATPSGDTAVAQVIITAGLGSPALARPFGVTLPLTAERGYHAMLPPGTLDVAIPVTFNERGFVVTPMEHGIRLAGTVELGAGRRPPDWARADILASHVRRLFGRELAPTDRWQGDRPTLPDYLPALGRASGVDNVILNAGHQHLGLTLAAVSARLVTALVGRQRPELDLRPFDPTRFNVRAAASAA